MPNREKVKKGLEIILNGCDDIQCEDCCFHIKEPTKPRRCGMIEEQIQEEALALLKEQEAKLLTFEEVEKHYMPSGGHMAISWIPLVRCKDCINCVKDPNGELYCDILAVGYEPLGSKKVNADWFCADGERQEVK